MCLSTADSTNDLVVGVTALRDNHIQQLDCSK